MLPKKLLYLFLILAFTAINFKLSAQKEIAPLNFIKIKEGISKVGMSTIIQDSYGFIWIGTNGEGLYKFDGNDYKSYKYKIKDSTALSSSLIYISYLDRNHKLWIGTEEGLNLYDKDFDRFNRIVSEEENGKDVNFSLSVGALGEDHHGNLFVGTYEKGLYQLDTRSNTLKKIPSSINEDKNVLNINTIKVSSNNSVYVGTNLGLFEYHSETNRLVKTFFTTEKGLISIDDPIKTLLVDHKNNLWIGTLSKGLIKVKKHPTKNQVLVVDYYPITNKRILSMIQIENQTILVGTENDGLFQIDQTGQVLKNYTVKQADNNIQSNSVWSLFLDAKKRIWIGYYNSGIAVHDELHDKFFHLENLPSYPNSLGGSSVTGIQQDPSKRLWISTDGGGIDLYDKKNHQFIPINQETTKPYSGLKSLDIQTIFIDSHENVWAGTWSHGLYLLKKNTNTFINYNIKNTSGGLQSNSILSFAEDSTGRIWIGTFSRGVVSYDHHSQTFKNYKSKTYLEHKLPNSSVRKIIIDKKDNLWIGTTRGLYRASLKNDVILVESMTGKMNYKYANKISANHILSLEESSTGDLWIGTRGAGLCHYDTSEDEFIWYDKFSGLTTENIVGIIESHDGDIWISGNSGINKFNLKTNTFVNYTINDGLLSNDFNFNATFKDSKGLLYFGNYKGLDFFNPERMKINKRNSSLYFTGLRIYNKDIYPNQKDSPLKKVMMETDTIVLSNRQSVFTINYTAVNYTRPEKNQYAYYLEGFEDSWNYVGHSRSATYTNLDHGNYLFKLKHANNDGVWNDTPLHLYITILPPWWKSNVAFFIYLVLLLLGIYLLNFLTQSRIKEKEALKNERTLRLQEEELHEKKLQFFTNISHEFRTPLTLMINPLQDIIRDKTLKLPERIRQKHNVIYKNTDRLYRLINELMDLRKLEFNKLRVKPQQLNLVKFTENSISYFKEEAFNKNIYLSLDADIPEISIWADVNMLEKILFNILSNAMKITPEGGVINVDLIANDNDYILPLISKEKPIKAIEIIISDTGPGLKENEIKRIFERFYQVENLNKTYYGGTGIGLEVVQSFVHLHKGEIIIKSKTKQGTAFKIILPKGKSHFSENEIGPLKNKDLVPNNQIQLTQLNPPILDFSEEIKEVKINNTLLIVEDNTELRNYLKNELKKTYKILLAINGKEGLEIAKTSSPDIILTDIMMPEMNGLDFCKFIKTDIRTSHIPLLMLTAKTTIEDRIQGISFGADAYMIKPFDLRLLKLRLSQLITSRELIFDKYFSAISGSEKNANATSIDKDFIQKVLSYINENISNTDLSVESLAAHLNLSRSQLYRKIKTLTGQTVNEFLRKIRLEKAKQILETTNTNISEVCYKVGFSSPSYFTKCFKAHFGILPTNVLDKE